MKKNNCWTQQSSRTA